MRHTTPPDLSSRRLDNSNLVWSLGSQRSVRAVAIVEKDHPWLARLKQDADLKEIGDIGLSKIDRAHEERRTWTFGGMSFH